MKDELKTNPTEKSWRGLIKAGGLGALGQLATLLGMMVLSFAISVPSSIAVDYPSYLGLEELPLILRDEFFSMLLIGWYLLTFPGMFAALRKTRPAPALIAMLGVMLGMGLAFANNPAFSLLHLDHLYTHSTDPVFRGQLLAAEQALMAASPWHSSAGFLAGSLLQGLGVFISLVMWQQPGFRKVTVVGGVLGNGFDLIQHVLSHLRLLPGLGQVLLALSGPFYILWFLFLGLDLLKLARARITEQV